MAKTHGSDFDREFKNASLQNDVSGKMHLYTLDSIQ